MGVVTGSINSAWIRRLSCLEGRIGGILLKPKIGEKHVGPAKSYQPGASGLIEWATPSSLPDAHALVISRIHHTFVRKSLREDALSSMGPRQHCKIGPCIHL